jgi:ketosteroid isomerase-like protein
MSHENVEVVERVLRRFGDEDIEAALEDIAVDATLDWSNSDAPDRGVYTGHEAWRAFFRSRDQVLAGRRIAASELIAPTANVVVLVARVSEQGRTSGAAVQALGASVWTLHEGRVVSFKLYQSREQALEALGLSGECGGVSPGPPSA